MPLFSLACCPFPCSHLGLGSYAEWEEERRIEFLTQELVGRRPLVPPTMPFTPASAEVMETFK